MIQCTRLAVERIGERAFELTDEQWSEQAKNNDEEMSFFLHQIGDAFEQQSSLQKDEPNESDESS